MTEQKNDGRTLKEEVKVHARSGNFKQQCKYCHNGGRLINDSYNNQTIASL